MRVFNYVYVFWAYRWCARERRNTVFLEILDQTEWYYFPGLVFSEDSRSSAMVLHAAALVFSGDDRSVRTVPETFTTADELTEEHNGQDLNSLCHFESSFEKNFICDLR